MLVNVSSQCNNANFTHPFIKSYVEIIRLINEALLTNVVNCVECNHIVSHK